MAENEITRTGSTTLSYTGMDIEKEQIEEWLAAVPPYSSIAVKVAVGDSRDPREAGYRKTTFVASWGMVDK